LDVLAEEEDNAEEEVDAIVLRPVVGALRDAKNDDDCNKSSKQSPVSAACLTTVGAVARTGSIPEKHARNIGVGLWTT
jgi:hypothetical protein